MKSKHVDASLQSCDACLPPLLFLSLLQPAFTLVIVLFAMLRITHVSMLRLRLMCRLVPHLKCFRFKAIIPVTILWLMSQVQTCAAAVNALPASSTWS